jgi:hypothetical protein
MALFACSADVANKLVAQFSKVCFVRIAEVRPKFLFDLYWHFSEVRQAQARFRIAPLNRHSRGDVCFSDDSVRY